MIKTLGIIEDLSRRILEYWNSKTISQQRFLTFQIATASLIYYIFSPTFHPSPVMFSKRPDKHTTGLINLRNDCFANSSLQAYSSLPGLTEYLNNFHKTFRSLEEFITSHDIDVGAILKSRKSTDSKFKNSMLTFDVPLHTAMATLIKKLQETQLTSRTISVWTFLHCLEGIFSAKISRSQHDAHELTQLINETLEHENLKVKHVYDYLLKNLQKLTSANASDYQTLEKVHPVEFPFSGLILTQMRCLSCKGVSKPSFTPFLMLTLCAPELPETDLETLLDENELEQIEGYQCLKCRITKIVGNEDSQNPSSPLVSDLVKLNDDSTLCINDDLPEALETFVKNYNVNGLDISRVTSVVFRKTQILKPPKIFGLHLSRSSFAGGNASRNQCRIGFKDNLVLSIGSEFKELEKYLEEDLPSRNTLPTVLTTDVNDMEDEEVQREDIDETGDDTEEEKTESDRTDSDDKEDSDTDKTDSDDDDVNSLATSTSYKGSKSTDLTSIHTAGKGTPTETLNNTPITRDQTLDLKEHFKRFKFNDNDVYKYKLRAVIRHVGSHTQGHYECYKRKPLFVKDAEGNIFKLTPEIEENVDVETDVSDVSSQKSLENPNMRRKFSTIMGRRPSIFHANPSQSDIQEIVRSGSATPAELLVGMDQDYFSEKLSSALKPESKPVKMKKIPSVIKSPFWRISDSSVTEVGKENVLIEKTSVYMLYYERIDRKQIKR